MSRKKVESYTLSSLFSGVGGIEYGFISTDRVITVYANEVDQKAALTYELNHGLKVDNRDIRKVDASEVPRSDIITAGFPCTSFSIAGYRKGFEDEHTGDLFFETLRIIVENKPKVVFLENVKNLKGHDKGNTFKVIMEALEMNGYFVKEKVMNSTEYGNIPQNRERIYIVGFKNKDAFDAFKFPEKIELETKLKSIVSFNKKVDLKYYYDERYKMFDAIKESVTKSDTLYQWRRVYVRENMNKVSPTLTANMGTGGHNVPLLKSRYGIRKITPKEAFGLQGFPKEFKLPKDVSDAQLYKQAGNSVVVPVVERIALNIIEALDSAKNKNKKKAKNKKET